MYPMLIFGITLLYFQVPRDTFCLHYIQRSFLVLLYPLHLLVESLPGGICFIEFNSVSCISDFPVVIRPDASLGPLSERNLSFHPS